MTYKVINRFSGEYRWISNFYPCEVYLDRIKYPSVEHAYQAAKTTGDRSLFLDCTAAEAKARGQSIPLRADWDEIKIDIMKMLVWQKFYCQSNKLGERLLETGNSVIIEGNDWGDTFWGVCDGVGENNLGRILSEVRNSVRENKILGETFQGFRIQYDILGRGLYIVLRIITDKKILYYYLYKDYTLRAVVNECEYSSGSFWQTMSSAKEFLIDHFEMC